MSDGDTKVMSMTLRERQQLFQPLPLDEVQIISQTTTPHFNASSTVFRTPVNIPVRALRCASPICRRLFRTLPYPQKIYELDAQVIQALELWIRSLQTLTKANLQRTAPGIVGNPPVNTLTFLNSIDMYILCWQLGMTICARKWLLKIRRYIRLRTTILTTMEVLAICQKVKQFNCYHTLVDPQTGKSFNEILFLATQKATWQYYRWNRAPAMTQLCIAQFQPHTIRMHGNKKLYTMIRYHENAYWARHGGRPNSQWRNRLR